MSQPTARRKRKEKPSSSNDNPSGSKVYIIKIVTDINNDLKFKLKPNDGAICSVAEEVVEIHPRTANSTESIPQTKQLNIDYALEAEKNNDRISDDNDDDIDPRNVDSPFINEDNDFYETESRDTDSMFANEQTEYSGVDPSVSDVSQDVSFVDCDAKLPLSRTSQKGNRKSGNGQSGKGKRFSGWIANRHKLKFLPKWLEEFPFIEYDEASNLMFCRACRKYVNDWRKTSPFVAGTDNFRASMLRYHQRSLMHTECQELYDTLTSEDNNALEKDLYRDQLSHVFKSVYFIFKNKMPYTHYPQLCESQKREGTDFSVYSSHLKVVPLVGKFIAMAFEKELGEKIADVPEFALIIDASFRRNIESHDLVYIKYIEGFIVQTVFLGVIDSSAKLHDSVYNTLCDLFKNYGISNWVDRVVYIMTDKSDTHMWRDGVINLIKSASPHREIFEVTYLSHKIKYCASIVQNHKITCTFHALLWSMYCFYERVDKGKKNLVNMNKELEEIIESYGCLPKNSYTTLYYEALQAVEEDYSLLVRLLEAEQLLLHFDFKVRKSGARVLSVITRSSFLLKLALFIDIFSCLSDFALKLGSDEILPYDVHILLDEVCSEIEKAANGEGCTTLEIQEELSCSGSLFRGIEITEDITLPNLLPEIKKFAQDVISYLKSIVNDCSLLEKSFIFNVCMWPEDDEIEGFGNADFVDIFQKFSGKEKHISPALAEWTSFKSRVLSLFPYEVRQNSKSVLLKMVSEFGEEFPIVMSVLNKILLLDFECNEIKRGYREMCLNKSFSRSMLSLQSLQTSMMVSMYGPPLSDFDYTLAMELFLNSRHRKFRKKIIDQKLTLNELF